jgi:hypothetical protein
MEANERVTANQSLPERSAGQGWRPMHALLLAAFLTAQALATVFLLVPGHLLADESIAHWMVKSFADSGTLSLWNGYGETPSPELVHSFLTVRDGHLYPPYPYLHPILATPFYWLFGFAGLFVLNSLCFTATVVLCYVMVRELFNDEGVALLACLMLVFATFAWQYSLAAWPHAIATFFVLLGFWLMTRAFFSEAPKSAILYALTSGLVAGFSVGVRIDCILLFPALILPFVFARPARFTEAVSVVAGAVPGLLILSATHDLKFGVFSPLSYGKAVYEPMPPAPVIALAVGAVLAAWILTRQRYVAWTRAHVKMLGLLAILVSVGLLFVIPETWHIVEKTGLGAYTLLVDIRNLDPAIHPAPRSPGGGVIYMGAHRKAFLQSLPFLPLILVPLGRLFRRDAPASAIGMLFIVPCVFGAYYSYAFLSLDAGGGLGLNQRYLIPTLPFLAALSAYGMKSLAVYRRGWCGPRVFVVIGIFTAGLFVFLTRIPDRSLQDLEFPLLTMPLLIAGALPAVLVAGWCLASFGRKTIRTLSCGLAIVALIWAGCTAFLYDYPRHRLARVAHHAFGRGLVQVVPDDALIFVDSVSFAPAFALLEKDRVRIAYPRMDRFQDARWLAIENLSRNRTVMASFSSRVWPQLVQGPFQGFLTTECFHKSGVSVRAIARPRAEDLNP